MTADPVAADPIVDTGGRPPLAVWLLVAWTLFVWVNRVRNVLGDASFTGGERAAPLALSGVVIVAALVVAALAIRGRRAPGPRSAAHLAVAVRALAALTTVVWVVRSVAIATGGHPVPFVVVHVLLGVVSIGLAAWAAIAAGRRSHKLLVTA